MNNKMAERILCDFQNKSNRIVELNFEAVQSLILRSAHYFSKFYDLPQGIVLLDDVS